MTMSSASLAIDSSNEQLVRRALLGLYGREASVLACQPHEYATSFPVFGARVDVGTKQLDLIIKDSGYAASRGMLHLGKPEHLYHPLRESLVYREVLSELPLGTPRFFGSIHHENLEHVYLVLERVQGSLLWQIGDFELWKEVAAQLARQHVLLGRQLHTRRCADIPWVSYSLYSSFDWLDRARSYLSGTSSQSSELLQRAELLLNSFGQELFVTQPTIVHGDFNPANILVRGVEGDSSLACPIDWEVAGQGPGLLDLASLISGDWSQAEREALSTAYFHEHAELVDTRLHRCAFDRQLALARICNAVRWLGWSDRWQPPKQQQNDWACELADAMSEFHPRA